MYFIAAFVSAVCHYRPSEKDRYHLPVCVGDTVHIVEEDGGMSYYIIYHITYNAYKKNMTEL